MQNIAFNMIAKDRFPSKLTKITNGLTIFKSLEILLKHITNF
jgi:hypothetical protein